MAYGSIGLVDGKYYDSGGLLGVDQDTILYVGKHGSDENDGKTPDRAYLTFGAALNAAVSGSTIHCFDTGTYTEDLTCKDNVNIYAPNARLNGQHTLADNHQFVFYMVDVPVSGVGFTKSGTSICYLDIKRLTVNNYATFLLNNESQVQLKLGEVSVGTESKLYATNASTPYNYSVVHFYFDEIYLHGASYILYAESNVEFNAFGHKIIQTSSSSLAYATGTNVTDSSVRIMANYIKVDTLSNFNEFVSANLFVHETAGSLSEGTYKFDTKPYGAGLASGLCPLDATGKVDPSYLPASIVGSMHYMGTWDCSSGAYPVGPAQGDYYVCSVAGTISGTAYTVGDWLAYNGTSWDRIDKQDEVLTTKGDIQIRDATSVTRLPIGVNGYVLTADSSQTEGLKWAAVPPDSGYTVGTGKNYSTIQSAIDAAALAGGVQVVQVWPGTYTENITMKKDVYVISSDPMAPRGHTISGTVTIDIGELGGLVTNHRTGLAGFLVSAPSGGYALDFTGSYGQEAWVRNCDLWAGAGTGLGIRHNNGAVDSGSDVSILHLENSHVWSSTPNTAVPISHSAGRLEIVGKLEADNSNPDGVAIAWSGSSNAWNRAGEVVTTGQITNTSSAAVTLDNLAVTVDTVDAIVANSAGNFTVGKAICRAITGALTIFAVNGAGVFIHVPASLVAYNFNGGAINESTINGGLGSDIAALHSRYDVAALSLTNKTIISPILTLKQGTGSTSGGEIQYTTGSLLKLGTGTGTKTFSPDETTTKGDVAVNNGTAPQRLAVGTNGQVLTADSAQTLGVKWAAVFSNPLTTKGDILTRDASADYRLPVGTDGQVLTADAASTGGIKWATASGSGDVTGPASSTDNDIVRFDGATGKIIQDGTDAPKYDDSGNVTFNARVLQKKGSDVASATDITLGNGNYFDITGSTTIETILPTGWTAGSVVILQFDGALTVKHNTGTGGAPFLLAGAADFSTGADDTLMVVYDGAYWREVSRTVI